MKKKLTAILLAAVMALPMFTLSLSAANTEKTDVIIELDLPLDGNSHLYTSLLSSLTGLLVPSLERGFVYGTLFSGFHARIPESDIVKLESLGYVKNVYISGVYEAFESTDSSMAAAEHANYSAAEDYGLSGKWVKVAVIDSGFDVSHPAFGAEVADSVDLSQFENVMHMFRLNAQVGDIKLNDMRYSSKIPFMFDYFGNDTDVRSLSSHGTHVAGLIGAQKTELSEMHGMAPDCQLLLMKVFDDSGSKGYDHLMIAAMEDAVKLDADIINLSLGNYAGSADPSRVVGLERILNSAEKLGCTVIAAAGNNGVSTELSDSAEKYGTNSPSAEYTDYGTIGSPASVNGVIGVAAADNSVIYAKQLIHADNKELKISYTDTNSEQRAGEISFSKHFDGMELEYAVIPGDGRAEDYESIDVKGKLVLVKRGGIAFYEKVNIAAEMGAVGVIVYNNVDGETFNMELSEAKLHAIAISLEDGERLASEKVHKLLISDTPSAAENTETGGKISASSSRGTTPSLTLKPDLTGIGGHVLSTVNGGSYDEKSGTSMAAPQISGVCSILYEKYRAEGMTDKIEILKEVKLALMNGAVPLNQENGVEYSPRAQGAGLVNLGASLERTVSVTHKESGLYKAELYDGLCESFEFTVNIKNLTDKAISVNVAATLTGDGYTRVKIKDKYTYFTSLEAVSDNVSVIKANGSENINKYAEASAPAVFNLKAGEDIDVVLTFELDKDYHGTMANIFTNGYFAEGYVYVTADNSTVSLPYLGYIGDWTAASVSDGNPYLEEYDHFKGTCFYIEANGKYIPSGIDIFDEAATYGDNVIAFSPNGDQRADEILLGASFLRNVRGGSMVITDSDNNVIYTKDIDLYITKSRLSNETTTFYFFWDGSDGIYERFKYPDGKYTMTVNYILDYGDNKTQTVSYDLYMDTKPPALDSVKFENGMLELCASDDSGILKIMLHSVGDNVPTIYLNPDGSSVFDLTDYTGDEIYYTVTDAAYNQITGKLTLSKLAG